jgi:cell division protein FtsW (lipid II flippase)
MSDNIFDIKNDRRLSQYLYRTGFGLWLVYILMGSSLLNQYAIHRSEVALGCFFMMVSGLLASLVFDYYHDHSVFKQRLKWLIISVLCIVLVLYLVIQSEAIAPQQWLRSH